MSESNKETPESPSSHKDQLIEATKRLNSSGITEILDRIIKEGVPNPDTGFFVWPNVEEMQSDDRTYEPYDKAYVKFTWDTKEHKTIIERRPYRTWKGCVVKSNINSEDLSIEFQEGTNKNARFEGDGPELRTIFSRTLNRNEWQDKDNLERVIRQGFRKAGQKLPIKT